MSRPPLGGTQRAGRIIRPGAAVGEAGGEGLLQGDMANAGVVAATADAAPGAWRRFVAHMLESFAAPGRTTLPEPPSRQAMYRALTRLQPAAERDPDGEEV